jgi:hypothetical protein
MEIFLYIIISTLSCVLWFFLIITCAKYTVGKKPHMIIIFLVMILAGPLGWASLAFAFAWDLVEKLSKTD